MYAICAAIFLFFLINGCGGGTSTEDDELETVGTDDGEDIGGDDNDDDTVNTEKLVGTPFEGMTYGDSFDETSFLCGSYRTDLIDSFPIKIFTALFTLSEEATILEAIEFVNETIGYAAYEIIDVWSDDVRVIYQTQELEDNASALTFARDISFNDTRYSETQSADWAIAIRDTNSVLRMYLIAHELGHAAGIRYHQLIDYENDDLVDLENESLMSLGGSAYDPPALTDYTYMMQRQGEIMQDHLGETGEIIAFDFDADCNEE